MEVGKPLFDRSPRQRKPIVLTKEGELFFLFAKRTQQAFDDLIVAIHNVDEIPMLVTVGTSPTNGTYIFPHLVGAFRRHFHSLTIDFKMIPGDSIHDEIMSGTFDIAITTNNTLHHDALIYEKLISDPLVLITHPDFPIKKIITVDQLKVLPLVLRSSGSTSKYILESNLEKLSCGIDDLNIVLRVFDNESVKETVKAGLAVGFVTASSISREAPSELKTIRVKDIYLDRNLYLMRARNPVRPFTPAMQCFWDFALSKKWM